MYPLNTSPGSPVTASMSSPQKPTTSRLLALCEAHLHGIDIQSYEFAPCYLWHDRPLYNAFGEQIRELKGDTIYLYEQSVSPDSDLFHELGHMVGRKLNMVGHGENGYHGRWESRQGKLIAEVTQQNHWSDYLNNFAAAQDNFAASAASELWAELFMLWHLYPSQPEAKLLDSTMQQLQSNDMCAQISALARLLCIET